MNRPRNASVAFIMVTLLLDALGVGLIIPVLPPLVTGFLAGDLAAGSRYYGIFIAVYAAMQFVFAPILGGLSDRFGRRTVLLASLLGASLDYVLLAFAPNLAWLFVGRVIAGITGASYSAATAYIADVTPPEKRTQSFGLLGAAGAIGFIIGPALGGLLGGFHLRLPFILAAGLNLMNCLYGLVVLPESLSREHRRPFSFRRANPFSSLVNLGRHPVVLSLTSTLVCVFLGQNLIQVVWALHSMAHFDWRESDVGVSLTVFGVASALVQGGLIRVMMPRLGERRAMMLGFMLHMIGAAAFGLATRGWMMYVILIPYALGNIAGPAAQTLITRVVGPSEQGELQGSLMSLTSITSIVGPLLGTNLFAHFSTKGAVPYIPGAAFFASAFLYACALLLAMRLFARTPEAAPASTPAP